MHTQNAKLDLLKQKVRPLFTEPGMVKTPIDGVNVFMRTAPSKNQHCLYKPMVILVLQGEKQSVLGSEKHTYHEGQVVVASVDIPTVGSVVRASFDKPFMTIVLDLNSQIIEQLLNEKLPVSVMSARRSMGIMDADEELLDAFYRLMCLMDYPDRQAVMAPMILREIHYLLLMSPLGDVLRSVNTKGSQNNQIARAVDWLKENYRNPLKIDELAKMFHMAESSFYRHFNKVTSLSPLQYQKRLRLYEAHRLMVAENVNVERAAYEVGYESPSQFNREYKRMFGVPPKTNVNRMRRAL